uniref:Uncharacterized protein n=1 Tax=Anopheles christyi TaxID=43041 RepID=A0A182KI62_9DIPT
MAWFVAFEGKQTPINCTFEVSQPIMLPRVAVHIFLLSIVLSKRIAKIWPVEPSEQKALCSAVGKIGTPFKRTRLLRRKSFTV